MIPMLTYQTMQTESTYIKSHIHLAIGVELQTLPPVGISAHLQELCLVNNIFMIFVNHYQCNSNVQSWTLLTDQNLKHQHMLLFTT